MEKVITIGRQYGSGGRDFGRILARELGVPFYDNELISLAAKESGFAEESFERAEKKATNSLLYSLAMGATAYGGIDFGTNALSLDDRIFLAQSKVILKVAGEGPCVIVGRCADYILKDRVDTFNIFVRASLDYHINRAIKEYGDPENKVGEIITKTDKSRANYYKYHVGESWTNLNNYDLVLRSDLSDMDTLVKGTIAILNN